MSGIGKIAGFVFDTIGGKAVAFGAGLLALIVWHQVDRAKQREVGRKEIKAAVGANNADVAKRAGDAGRRSFDPGVGGVLNPYYRAD